MIYCCSENPNPLSAARTHSDGSMGTNQRTTTISKRPPVPLPRSPQSLRKFPPPRECSPKVTLQILKEQKFSSSSKFISIDRIRMVGNLFVDYDPLSKTAISFKSG